MDKRNRKREKERSINNRKRYNKWKRCSYDRNIKKRKWNIEKTIEIIKYKGNNSNNYDTLLSMLEVLSIQRKKILTIKCGYL